MIPFGKIYRLYISLTIGIHTNTWKCVSINISALLLVIAAEQAGVFILFFFHYYGDLCNIVVDNGTLFIVSRNISRLGYVTIWLFCDFGPHFFSHYLLYNHIYKSIWSTFLLRILTRISYATWQHKFS